jgi:hypothetical protein
MSAVKTVAWGGLAWALLGMTARADSISSANGSWVFFGAAGGSSTPAFSSTSSPGLGSASQASVTVAQTTSSGAAASGGQTYDAFINLTDSGYSSANELATGTPQPWYTSPAVTKFFNGSTPTTSQQLDFENKVLQNVQHTFDLANLHPTLTLDPNAPANHMLSVVAGASYGANPNAIGITNVGHDGFGFIDKLTYATSIDQLATAVSKNVSHELMHAFGVANHPDQTGTYIDSGTASWSLLTNPDSTFSPGAVTAIKDTRFSPYAATTASGAQMLDGDQEILASPVPEPTTLAVWGLGLLGMALYRRRCGLASLAA